MLDFDTEYDITRNESVLGYFFVIITLMVLQLYVLAFVYGMLCVTLVSPDEPIEDMEDEGIYLEESKMGDSLISELYGLELAVEDIDAYIQAVSEEFNTDDTNDLVEQYNNNITCILQKTNKSVTKLTKIKSRMPSNTVSTKPNPRLIVASVRSGEFSPKVISKESGPRSMRSRIASSKPVEEIVAHLRRQSELGEDSPEVKVLRSEGVTQIVMNNYLRNSYIAMGIYPGSEFDFHLLRE